MIKYVPIRNMEDINEKKRAIEEAADDVIEVLKKHGANLGNVEEIFRCVRVALGNRPV